MKKIISVLLAALMIVSVLPFAAFAAEPAKKQVRFIVDDDLIWGIDFSDVIRDKTTVNKGKIVLDNPGDTDTEWSGIWDYVEFDEDCVAHFFYYSDGEKVYDCLYLGVYNWTAEVRAVDGYLFDDAASYSFSIEDVYESLDAETFRLGHYPLVEVTKTDGDVVKEMEFCFAPTDGEDDCALLPLTVDMNKEIEMTVNLLGTLQSTFSLVPVKYDGKGTLTVSVRDHDGSEGVALHFAEIRVGENYRKFYSFEFYVPQGLFRYKNLESEGFVTDNYTDLEIWNMPIWSIVNVQVPNWLVKIGDAILKFIPAPVRALFNLLAVFVVYPFPFSRIYRAARNSFAAYGIDLDAIAKESIFSGRFFAGIGTVLKNLFNGSL